MQAKQVAEELELVRATFASVARASDLRDFDSFVALLKRHGERDANALIRSLVDALSQEAPSEETIVPDVQHLVASLHDAGVDRVQFNKLIAGIEAKKKTLSLVALNMVAAGYVGSLKNFRTKKAAIEAVTDHFETLFQRDRKSREIQSISGTDN